MFRAHGVAALLCIAASACRGPRAAEGSGGGPTVSTSAPVDAGDEAAGPSPTDALEVFLEAARTNLQRPHPGDRAESQQLYLDAAKVLPHHDPPVARPPGEIPYLVADVLASSDDERAPRALMEWAANPAARSHVPLILSYMRARPRGQYFETCKAILADEALAGDSVDYPYVRPGLLGEALWTNIRASLHVEAFELALALPGHVGEDLVKRVAMNPAASAPNPRTLAALRCEDGETRVESEAQALASPRIMALNTLGDRALLTRVASDPHEPTLVRQWTQRMLKGGPDLTRVGWEARLDWRQRLSYEHSMMEFVGRDTSPCFTLHPRPKLPDAWKDLTPSAAEPGAPAPAPAAPPGGPRTGPPRAAPPPPAEP